MCVCVCVCVRVCVCVCVCTCVCVCVMYYPFYSLSYISQDIADIKLWIVYPVIEVECKRLDTRLLIFPIIALG